MRMLCRSRKNIEGIGVSCVQDSGVEMVSGLYASVRVGFPVQRRLVFARFRAVIGRAIADLNAVSRLGSLC